MSSMHLLSQFSAVILGAVVSMFGAPTAGGCDDQPLCNAEGCVLTPKPPVYSPPGNNCGQYVSEGATSGSDGVCVCDFDDEAGGWSCFEKDFCAGSKSYTVTPPAGGRHQVCEWLNYPATPATYGTNGYGAAYTATLTVLGCGSQDFARLYISARPDSGPTNCNDNMVTTCTMTFELICPLCSSYSCP